MCGLCIDLHSKETPPGQVLLADPGRGGPSGVSEAPDVSIQTENNRKAWLTAGTDFVPFTYQNDPGSEGRFDLVMRRLLI